VTAVAVPQAAKPPSHSSAVAASAADHVDSAVVVAVEIAAVEVSSAAHKPVAQPYSEPAAHKPAAQPHSAR